MTSPDVDNTEFHKALELRPSDWIHTPAAWAGSDDEPRRTLYVLNEAELSVLQDAYWPRRQDTCGTMELIESDIGRTGLTRELYAISHTPTM